MAIKNYFMNLIGKRNNQNASERSMFYATLYPESVRYALSYNGAKLGKSEFHSLVHNFVYEVVYLMVKAVAYEPERQRQFIEDLTKIFMHTDHQDALKAFLRSEIDTLPEGTIVKGTKLAQLSRYGTAFWQQSFRNLVKSCIAEDEFASPRLIAHTPFVAYHHFVELYKNHGFKRMSIIVPDWMIDEQNPLMGYRVLMAHEPQVFLQEKSICLHGNWDCLGAECERDQSFCRRSFFIDDTINTATTSRKVTNFWNSEYGVQVPDAQIRVITDLRQQPVRQA